ncbi:MAG: hypothetical protein HQ582_34965, partial [Planctomycetes bacterium]|nr:hypothetical protein [Planctomycetota bacterium]
MKTALWLPLLLLPLASPAPADELAELRSSLNLDGFRKAVTRLAEKYEDAYPRSAEHLLRIDAFEKQLAACGQDPQAISRLAEQVDRLRRQALVADHPRLACGKLLFIKRHTYQSSHYYTDYIDGCDDFAGNLCLFSLADDQVTELVPELEGGVFGRYDLSFDGRRIVFDYKPRQEAGFRIWEVGIDGRGLRQITFDPPDEAERIDKYRHPDLKQYAGRDVVYNHHTDDMHPCYLPDGRIAFI